MTFLRFPTVPKQHLRLPLLQLPGEEEEASEDANLDSRAPAAASWLPGNREAPRPSLPHASVTATPRHEETGVTLRQQEEVSARIPDSNTISGAFGNRVTAEMRQDPLNPAQDCESRWPTEQAGGDEECPLRGLSSRGGQLSTSI